MSAGVLWALRACNSAAQRAAAELQLPVVGGSDAHSLRTIGQAYMLFRGSGASDLYRAIQRGQVQCGGGYSHRIDVSRALATYSKTSQ
jgi:hypothetical protein